MACSVIQRKLFKAKNLRFLLSARNNTTSTSLAYDNFGDPLCVVKMIRTMLPTLGKHDVLVQMLAAPVNPADINTIQGKYAIQPRLPSIGGSEGVGIVAAVGSEVKRIDVGNKVILVKPSIGTWRTIGIYKMDSLKVIPFSLGLAEAATLTINPCTAYRLLTDFVPVRYNTNLVVIQNGANSAVGQNVIQLCKIWGIPNINIVRNRPQICELKQYLQCLGATYVLTEQELACTDIFKTQQIDKPCLGLNCVGGPSSLLLMKTLKRCGVMVTYGGMSKKPIIVPAGMLIFNNINLNGFWMTEWYKTASFFDRDTMLTEIINCMCSNELKASAHKFINFDRFQEALANTLSPSGYVGYKYILDCSQEY